MQPSQSSTDYTNNPDQTQFKRIVLLSVLGIVIIGFLWWFFTRAFIEIRTESSASGDITYQLISQSDRKKTEVKQSDKTFKKQVSKGSYEVTVRQGRANFFSVAKAGGAFSTTRVDATLQPERARRFIGNQPEDCMYVLAGILLSYECKGSFDSMNTHIPATEDLPTLTKQTLPAGEDVIQGLVRTANGENILVLYEAEVAGHDEFVEEDHSPHVGFKLQGNPLDASLDIADRTPLHGLNRDVHSIAAYREGFIAYNQEVSEIVYYSSLNAEPQKLPLEKLDDDGLTARYVSTRGDTYVIGYINEEGQMTTAIAYRGNKTTRLDFDKPINAGMACGQQKLCTVNEDGLDVYDIKGDKSDFLYSVGDVIAIGNLGSGNQLVVVRKQNVLALDVETRTGVVQYTFGTYGFCGIHFQDNSYNLCVRNRDGGKSVLAIDQQQVSDDVDKKIAELQALSGVDTVSTYGDYISIEPNTGESIPSPTGRGFIFNPETIKRVKEQINNKLQELDFGAKYRISNTLD